ncbi:hypothetical protein GCM10025867_08560 [Frondihabitans sucicola]|uniref:Uncharacterized protein n=2 Tax=Frondihabitans sucicola TaxID=1268041 RepID=A0ABN6XY96_9MICO|nr:hypothetical protein GCM10025867_08560 [Frondihabitans sucicola]
MLSEHPGSDRLARQSRIVECQEEVDGIIEFGIRPLADLADTASVIAALRAVNNLDRIAELADVDASSLVGLIETEAHPGSSAPRDALAMGALATAARKILTAREETSQEWIRMTSFERVVTASPRADQIGPGSARDFLQKYPGSLESPNLRQRILRAHDQDLSLAQRITWGSSITAGTRARYPKSGRYIPLHGVLPRGFWPQWTSRLDCGGAVDISALQKGLVIATSLADVHEDHEPSEGYRPALSIAKYLRIKMLGNKEKGTQLIAGIIELALWLKANGIPIDYARRRAIPSPLLLQGDHWERICETAGANPGQARRHSLARLYLAQRIQGARRGRGHDLPASNSLESEYTDFKFALTRELQSALDDYARALLRIRGIDEPLRWEPPLLLLERGIPGRELGDINIDRMHELILNGEHRQGVLAKELGVTQRHVVGAVDEWPPLTSSGVNVAIWNSSDWAAA